MSILGSTNKLTGAYRRAFRNAGAPSDGTSGTFAGVAEKGDLLIDSTNGNVYQNTGTSASPVWSQLAVYGQEITVTDSSGTAGSGGYGVKYVATFTADAASAHKGGFFQVKYEPPSDDGTACSIGLEGQVTAKGDLTESNSYPGYGYGLQGRFHLLDGATINSGDLDPGSTYAGVRAVITDAGTATLTKGTLTALMAECQVSQDADNTNFRTYLGWFRCQGSTTSTDITAGIRIESGDAWGNNIQKAISMRDFVTGIYFETAGSSYAFEFSAESGCLDGTNGTYSTADGFIKCKHGSTDIRIPYYEGAD